MNTSEQSASAGRRLLAASVLVLAIAVVSSVWLYRSTSPFERCVKEQVKIDEYELIAIHNCKDFATP